jgi:parallel beta-helix repeat protein
MEMNTSRHALWAVLAAVVVVVGTAAGASAATTSGTLTITTNTTLTSDFHGQIVIAADDVILDCAGHDITGSGWDPGTGTGDFAGVSFSGLTGVTVKDCHVTGGFNEGFIIWQSSHNTFVNNTSSGNANSGFALADGSTSNTLTGNRATGNAHRGYAIGGGSNSNTLER